MKRLGIKKRFVITLAVIVTVTLSLYIIWSCVQQQRQIERELIEQGQALSTEMNAVWEFVSINQNTINTMSDGSYEFKGLHCAVAGKAVAALFTKNSDYIIRYVNENPRNMDNSPDEFEGAALKAFKSDTGVSEYYGHVDFNGANAFRYLAPMKIDSGCLECHGNPAGEIDITGYPKEGWEIGSVAGAISIVMPVDVYESSMVQRVFVEVGFYLTLLLVIVVIVFFTLRKTVTNPLEKINEAIVQVRGGNLNTQITDNGVSVEIQGLIEQFNQMALELKAAYNGLENEVNLRTDELARANDSLREQREIVEQVNARLMLENQFKSDFLAMTSHEFRTPLTSIIAYLDLLRNSKKPRDDKEALVWQKIENNSQILLTMINNILDIAKIEAGGTSMTLETIDLGDVVSDVTSSMMSLIEEKEIEFNLQIESDVPLIVGDWDKLRSIVMNLLSNAVKYTPQKGLIELRISCVDDARSVRIIVDDNGIGIKEDEIDKIFDKFIQSDTATVRKYNGSGLGLTLVKVYVELHGGNVMVESTLGKGSRFVVTLPAGEVAEATDEKDHDNR